MATYTIMDEKQLAHIKRRHRKRDAKATASKFKEGTMVVDGRGKYYRVLETEPTLLASNVLRVIMCHTVRGQWKEHGEVRMIHASVIRGYTWQTSAGNARKQS